MAGHVFHWRHGWIPLDHTAALDKTRGDRKAAAAMLSDARSSSAGIRSRRDVAHAIRDLPNVPARDRHVPKQQVTTAAHRHGVEHLLPSSMGGPAALAARKPGPALSPDLLRDFAGGSAADHLVTDEHGTHFSPERQALHDKIIRDHVAGHTAQAHPSFVMLGGGPASGKSKAKNQAGLDFPDAIHIDPDEIKKMLPEYGKLHPDEAASFVHEESSYLAKQVTAAALKSRANVVLDAVGNTSVDAVRKKIDNARAAGYAVHGRYVTIPIEEAQQRALERGQKSGRVVRPTVIEKSHRSVSEVFPALLDHFDTAALYDNTSTWKTVLTKRAGEPAVIHDHAAWQSFLGKAHEQPSRKVNTAQQVLGRYGAVTHVDTDTGLDSHMVTVRHPTVGEHTFRRSVDDPAKPGPWENLHTRERVTDPGLNHKLSTAARASWWPPVGA